VVFSAGDTGSVRGRSDFDQEDGRIGQFGNLEVHCSSQSRIDGFAFEREHTEYTLVHAVQRLGSYEPLERLDPEAMHVAKRIFKKRITYARNAYDALKGADALLVVTEWNEFREPDFERMKKLLNAPVVFDGRNIFDPKQIRSLGFTYSSIGRP